MIVTTLGSAAAATLASCSAATGAFWLAGAAVHTVTVLAGGA
jgi:hypothetical protein